MVKAIKGFEKYLISSEGVVERGGKPKAVSIARGYIIVNLWKDNVQYPRRVSRLVAQAFIPNPDNLPEVNHKDGNKLNNNVNNLEWVTRSENILHSYRIGLRKKPLSNAKINQSIADKIRELRGIMNYADIGKVYGVSYSTVAHIMRGSRWPCNSKKGSRVA